MTPAARRLALAGAALLIAVALVLVGAVLGRPDGVADTGDAPGTASSDGPAGSLEALQARLARLPGDHPGWAALGQLYLDRARVTGDPSWYAKAQAALDRSLEVKPDGNAAALTGLAALQAAQHDFVLAAETAQRALDVNPFDATAYGVLADALTEVGRYDDAADALQRMVDVDPGFAALTRISYARELRGDIQGARTVMQRALDTAPTAENAGFALHHLGDLAWHHGGDLDAAAAFYDRGLARDPASLPLQAAAARAAAAAGRTEEALEGYTQVTSRVPVMQYLVEHGELLDSLGRTDDAQAQYDLVRTTLRLLEASGSAVDLEAALFEADHGSPERALAAASAAHRRAPSVFAEDALAWALHRNGRDAEALEHARKALALGGRPASFLYHQGMVEAALGRRADAARSLREALETDPHFSVPHAATARATLAGLGG